jgi:hypothetical protein
MVSDLLHDFEFAAVLEPWQRKETIENTDVSIC